MHTFQNGSICKDNNLRMLQLLCCIICVILSSYFWTTIHLTSIGIVVIFATSFGFGIITLIDVIAGFKKVQYLPLVWIAVAFLAAFMFFLSFGFMVWYGILLTTLIGVAYFITAVIFLLDAICILVKTLLQPQRPRVHPVAVARPGRVKEEEKEEEIPTELAYHMVPVEEVEEKIYEPSEMPVKKTYYMTTKYEGSFPVQLDDSSSPTADTTAVEHTETSSNHTPQVQSRDSSPVVPSISSEAPSKNPQRNDWQYDFPRDGTGSISWYPLNHTETTSYHDNNPYSYPTVPKSGRVQKPSDERKDKQKQPKLDRVEEPIEKKSSVTPTRSHLTEELEPTLSTSVRQPGSQSVPPSVSITMPQTRSDSTAQSNICPHCFHKIRVSNQDIAPFVSHTYDQSPCFCGYTHYNASTLIRGAVKQNLEDSLEEQQKLIDEQLQLLKQRGYLGPICPDAKKCQETRDKPIVPSEYGSKRPSQPAKEQITPFVSHRFDQSPCVCGFTHYQASTVIRGAIRENPEDTIGDQQNKITNQMELMIPPNCICHDIEGNATESHMEPPTKDDEDGMSACSDQPHTSALPCPLIDTHSQISSSPMPDLMQKQNTSRPASEYADSGSVRGSILKEKNYWQAEQKIKDPIYIYQDQAYTVRRTEEVRPLTVSTLDMLFEPSKKEDGSSHLSQERQIYATPVMGSIQKKSSIPTKKSLDISSIKSQISKSIGSADTNKEKLKPRAGKQITSILQTTGQEEQSTILMFSNDKKGKKISVSDSVKMRSLNLAVLPPIEPQKRDETRNSEKPEYIPYYIADPNDPNKTIRIMCRCIRKCSCVNTQPQLRVQSFPSDSKTLSSAPLNQQPYHPKDDFVLPVRPFQSAYTKGPYDPRKSDNPQKNTPANSGCPCTDKMGRPLRPSIVQGRGSLECPSECTECPIRKGKLPREAYKKGK